MNKKLSFAVENITPVEDSNLDKSQFALLKVDAFSTGRSWHDTFTTEENLRKNAPTILQKPFVFFTDKRFDDAGGHDNGEVAAGFVPHNSRLEFKTLSDGRIMLSCDVLVWRRYSGDLLKFFNRDGGKKGVSVEIEIFQSRDDPASGLLELIDYCFDAITCLGDLIKPAIPNAEAVLQFSKEFEQAKEEYEFSSKYNSIDFSIPKKVKSNAQKALDSHKQSRSGATSTALAVARHLVKEEKSTPEKIRQITKFFSRKNLDAEHISFALHGGKDGMKWSTQICNSLDDADKKIISYFGEEMYFPYKSKEDMNPALKGIEPPITVSQANEISRQADAIGSDDGKNGWAIAISNFKKTHVVKDGKWVKKEHMSSDSVEDDLDEKEEFDMKKKKDEATVTDEEKLDMAAEPEDKKEEPENKEETVAPPEEPEKEEKKEDKMSDDENKENQPDDEKKEGEEFSFGFDVANATALMSDKEICQNALNEFSKGKDADFSVIAAGMYAAMCHYADMCKSMSTDKEAYLAKMSELESFKANVENDKKQQTVDLTLKELSEKFEIPQESFDEMKKDGYEIDFSKLEEWQTSVRAKAVVNFAVIANKENKGVTRIGITHLFNVNKPADGDLWVGGK